ncbi:nitroreductase [Kordiimonas sp. SCSIO 12610]|uniref:nitroreductase family protein n=1 Tax=Kordiimonas sp. SCSIO 12610 TaxID=2829597 RepID=UPI00210B24E1|nr:nitroreductase [Kordiimonas sp. SCSIO 12610]UTW55967.1 nitroreductase [Kordiimonas sp. SCSIO 12610]
MKVSNESDNKGVIMTSEDSKSEITLNKSNPETLDVLMTRRSVKARDMVSPGPDKETLDKILNAAIRVPDHGKLTPWRFIVLEGAEREKLGDLIANVLISENNTSEKIAEKMKGYATQGPTLVVAIFSPSNERPIPIWEQWLSAGAACQNMLIAATALGVASQWLTGWASTSRTVASGLGLSEMEQIAGFIFFGTQKEAPEERPRPDLNDRVIFGMPDPSEAAGCQ